jgi:hypothetical protein
MLDMMNDVTLTCDWKALNAPAEADSPLGVSIRPNAKGNLFTETDSTNVLIRKPTAGVDLRSIPDHHSGVIGSDCAPAYSTARMVWRCEGRGDPGPGF